MYLKCIAIVLFYIAHLEGTSTYSFVNSKRIVTIYRGARDAVKNEGCIGSICSNNGLHCAGKKLGYCCTCECKQDAPNYIVSQGKCLSNNDVGSCKYSLDYPSKPIASLELAGKNSGWKWFYEDPSNRIANTFVCSHEITTEWYYLDVKGKWKRGEQYGVFSVAKKFITVGAERNRYRLTKLKWNKKLDAKYAGVIIKVILSCQEKRLGCLLVKSLGTKEYDTSPPKPTTTSPPTTSAPTTSAPSTSIPVPIDDTYPPPTDENNVDGSKGKQSQGDGKKNQASGGGAPNAALAPALGVVGALLLIIALTFVAVMLRRRRQKRKNEKPWINPETASVANLDDNAEPIYAEVNKGDDFDNPLYNDPALDMHNRRSAHLGPLPQIPGTYQALNELTRKSQDYDNPIEGVSPSEDYDNPPVGNADDGQGVASDYDNPPAQGAPDSTSDYDNPPAQGAPDSTSDYDNPPAQGAPDSTSDYDNPPAQGAPDSTSDYDNPPAQGAPDSASDYDNPAGHGAPDSTSDYDNSPLVESEKNDYDNPKEQIIDTLDTQF